MNSARGERKGFVTSDTDTPAELPELRVRLENSDSYIYTPGFEFVGWMEGDYAAQVVRLTGITYDEALPSVRAQVGTGAGILIPGLVVGPGATVVPDLARKLPGRGIWVAANREAVAAAAEVVGGEAGIVEGGAGGIVGGLRDAAHRRDRRSGAHRARGRRADPRHA